MELLWAQQKQINWSCSCHTFGGCYGYTLIENKQTNKKKINQSAPVALIFYFEIAITTTTTTTTTKKKKIYDPQLTFNFQNVVKYQNICLSTTCVYAKVTKHMSSHRNHDRSKGERSKPTQTSATIKLLFKLLDSFKRICLLQEHAYKYGKMEVKGCFRLKWKRTSRSNWKKKNQQLSLYLCCSVSGMVTSWCSHLLSGSCSEPINRCEKKALATGSS